MIDEKRMYAREFNETLPSWTEDQVFNKIYLRTVQGYFNELLMSRGYVFLRDIYENLGIPVTKESIIVGWYYDPKDSELSNYIDLSFQETGNGSSFMLHFNVDGDITKYF